MHILCSVTESCLCTNRYRASFLPSTLSVFDKKFIVINSRVCASGCLLRMATFKDFQREDGGTCVLNDLILLERFYVLFCQM